MFLKFFILICLSYITQASKDPLLLPGRTTMIHLFEWKYTDIANECERYLGPKSYGAIQISPANEHAVVTNPNRPWWERYQPVSYRLVSRSGLQPALADMIARCNAAGVRVYVDVVINHMAALTGVGSAGTSFSGPNKYFPSVPFGPNDFNDRKCKTNSGNIENYNDPAQVRDCKLFGLPDLATGNEYVRQKIADYLNSLIDLGVAGFRVDSVKNIWPDDLNAIYAKLKNVRSDVFGANKRPFILQEVIDLGNEAVKATEYTGFGRVTEFKYGAHLTDIVGGRNGLKMAYLKAFEISYGLLPSGDSLVFVDNHDSQRGHGPGGEILSFRTPRKYKIANAFMLAWPYSFVQLMSSYDFPLSQDWLGPPTNSDNSIKDVTINSDGSCGNGWVCEHRWRSISNMVEFRNKVSGEPVRNWWDNGNNQIAFSRGSKGFIAINNEEANLEETLQCDLPPGTYCDIISGNKVNNSCTGKVFVVNFDGTVRVQIKSFDDEPIVAFHIDSKL